MLPLGSSDYEHIDKYILSIAALYRHMIYHNMYTYVYSYEASTKKVKKTNREDQEKKEKIRKGKER